MAWWSVLNGTIVNIGTVAVGSTLGFLLSARIPARFRRIILDCLGLVTIILGIDAGVIGLAKVVTQHGAGIATYGARVAMVVVGSLIVGAILGAALRLHDRLEGLGGRIHARFGGAGDAGPTGEVGGAEGAGGAGDATRRGARFAEGFLSASVIFCVGPLTLLGCLNNGAYGDPSYLYIKSFLDGFCSMALAASLGAGVLFSLLTILFFQGGLSVAASCFATGLPEISLQLMNVVGGMVLLATALMILEIRKIPVADLLPGIFLPPLAVWLVESIAPGTLLAIQ